MELLVILTCLFVLMSLIRYNPFYKWIIRRVDKTLNKSQFNVLVQTPSLVLKEKNQKANNRNSAATNDNFTYFKHNSDCNLKELGESLLQLNDYTEAAYRINDFVLQRSKELERPMVRQLNQIQYFNKLSQIDEGIRDNGKLVVNIVKSFLQQLVQSNIDVNKTIMQHLKVLCGKLGYKIIEDELGGFNMVIDSTTPFDTMMETDHNDYRTFEAISHISRDWSSDFKEERKPILDYIMNCIPKVENLENTLVCVPGSGLGRISHEIAERFNTVKVQSIEWSSLMHICNQAIYNIDEDFEVRPFVIHYSNQLNVENQLRSYTIPASEFKKPHNIDLLWGDFRKYIPLKNSSIGYSDNINDSVTDLYENILVVTPFFIDTAENLFEYFSSIESLQNHCKNLFWVNVGPLKYGTRPLVQLNNEELKKLRALRGWVDIDEDVQVNDINKLAGYLTDKKGLYQGYYGLTKFFTKFNKSRE